MKNAFVLPVKNWVFDAIAKEGTIQNLSVKASWFWRSRIFTDQYKSTSPKKYIILRRGNGKETLMFELEDANWLGNWETIYIHLGWRMGEVKNKEVAENKDR